VTTIKGKRRLTRLKEPRKSMLWQKVRELSGKGSQKQLIMNSRKTVTEDRRVKGEKKNRRRDLCGGYGFHRVVTEGIKGRLL